jgi:hypothetical protein
MEEKCIRATIIEGSLKVLTFHPPWKISISIHFIAEVVEISQ